mgnify:CR=1 FL=1
MLYEQQCQFDPTCLTLSPSAARMTPCASVIAVRYESIYIVVCTLPQVQSIIVFSIRFCIIIGNLKYTYTSGMSLDRWSRSLSSFCRVGRLSSPCAKYHLHMLVPFFHNQDHYCLWVRQNCFRLFVSAGQFLL